MVEVGRSDRRYLQVTGSGNGELIWDLRGDVEGGLSTCKCISMTNMYLNIESPDSQV